MQLTFIISRAYLCKFWAITVYFHYNKTIQVINYNPYIHNNIVDSDQRIHYVLGLGLADEKSMEIITNKVVKPASIVNTYF